MKPRWPLKVRFAAQATMLCLFLVLLVAPAALGQTGGISPPSTQAEHIKSRPIPVGWKVLIVVSLVIAAGAVVRISVRAWKSSNLFDREYHLPPVTAVALCFGADKSGGSMATIHFGDSDSPSP